MTLKKSIIITALIFILYNIFIIVYQPSIIVSQNLWQENIIKAQDYIYENPDKDIIIGGSSLAARLRSDLLPDDVVNLSFTGSSIYDCITIVNKIKAKPKILLLETNFITRPLNKDFITGLFHPLFFKIRYYIPALREKYQPMNLFASTSFFRQLSSIIGKINSSAGTDLGKKNGISNKNKSEEKNNPVFKKVLDIALERHNHLPKAPRFSRKLNKLKDDIDMMQKRGIKVILFEMPMHPQIAKSHSAVYIREKIYQFFPKDAYSYLSLPDCKRYNTADGLHLDNRSALEYTKEFIAELNQFKIDTSKK